MDASHEISPQPGDRRRRAADAAAASLAAAVTLAVVTALVWPLPLHVDGWHAASMFGDSHAWVFEWVRTSLISWKIPHETAEVGYPQVRDARPIALAPAAVFTLLPLFVAPITAANWVQLGSLPASAAAAWPLIRRWTDADRWTCAAAAVAYALGPTLLSTYAMGEVSNTQAWILPIFLLLLDARRWLWLGAFVAVSAVTSPYYALAMPLIVMGWAGWSMIGSDRADVVQRAVPAVLAVALGLLPAWGLYSLRPAPQRDQVFQPARYVGGQPLPDPSPVARPEALVLGMEAIPAEPTRPAHVAYLGLVLGVAGAAGGARGGRGARAAAALAAGGAVLALGPQLAVGSGYVSAGGWRLAGAAAGAGARGGRVSDATRWVILPICGDRGARVGDRARVVGRGSAVGVGGSLGDRGVACGRCGARHPRALASPGRADRRRGVAHVDSGRRWGSPGIAGERAWAGRAAAGGGARAADVSAAPPAIGPRNLDGAGRGDARGAGATRRAAGSGVPVRHRRSCGGGRSRRPARDHRRARAARSPRPAVGVGSWSHDAACAATGAAAVAEIRPGRRRLLCPMAGFDGWVC
jgi:hypothetical protein